MNPHHAAMPEWMFRLVYRRPFAAPTSTLSSRVEVCPPQLWPSSLSWRSRIKRLLSADRWLPESSRPVNRLTAAKGEFLMQLADLPGDEPRRLAERISRVRSLRELWHLRMATYGVVACATSQSEAERRLAELNRHFPTRTARATALSSALPAAAIGAAAYFPRHDTVAEAPRAPLASVEAERANAPTMPAPL